MMYSGAVLIFQFPDARRSDRDPGGHIERLAVTRQLSHCRHMVRR